MIFYQNNTIEGSVQDIGDYLTEDESYLLVSELEFLQKLDFHNFNYFNFEQDVIDLNNAEFAFWFDRGFQPWLINIDQNYLDLDYEDLFYQFNNIEEKRLFLLKIVNFVMYLLPYEILRNIFINEDISNSVELLEYLEDDHFLITLRESIMFEIDRNKKGVEDFVDALFQLGKVAKKNLEDEDVVPLKEHIEKQNFFLDIFKRLIENTDMQKLKNLIIQMSNTDEQNLLS